jgi:hypothetical protein
LPSNNIQITAGSGTRLGTWSYTEDAVTKHDEKFIPGEYPYPTYTVTAGSVSVATTSDHIIAIQAGASLNVRIRRIYVVQSTLVTAADSLPLLVNRLTTAGTGGTAITPAPYRTDDAASGATARSLPTGLGTVSTELFRRRIVLTQTYATSSSIAPFFEWVQLPNEEPLIILAGTSNGIAVRVGAGRAGAAVDLHVEFVETSF